MSTNETCGAGAEVAIAVVTTAAGTTVDAVGLTHDVVAGFPTMSVDDDDGTNGVAATLNCAVSDAVIN